MVQQLGICQRERKGGKKSDQTSNGQSENGGQSETREQFPFTREATHAFGVGPWISIRNNIIYLEQLVPRPKEDGWHGIYCTPTDLQFLHTPIASPTSIDIPTSLLPPEPPPLSVRPILLYRLHTRLRLPHANIPMYTTSSDAPTSGSCHSRRSSDVEWFANHLRALCWGFIRSGRRKVKGRGAVRDECVHDQ